MKKVAFLFSGRGSLIQSVINAVDKSRITAELSVIITNNIEFTSSSNPLFLGRKVNMVNHKDFSSRSAFDEHIAGILRANQIDLVILGGFRRIFTREFAMEFGSITMNTHPSLLPALPGDKAQQKSLDMGLRITGATLHFINEEVDAGPIIDQEPVRIYNGMTENDLRQAIIEVEQKMIYRAILSFLDGNLMISGNKIIYKDYMNVQNPE
ncbi:MULTISPECIES: phosphoribosylglycinamide formyltransferase [Edwardsiella]|uniref:phosphoribosylglycinamide formyltransferase 1 n=2 Tax=Edwardsiella anguillarum TaxID=1821960 RepID=A0A076LN45_9GAMM|nr:MULTISPECIES: formyltransferase family protein [Edwardsiella]AKM48476.1 phosphoribosylglycinamide formyltransferase [Edwardsiella sp. EA181011]GAJ67726.1 putative phosphoribosylglycinamide formyltransferase [Edwardsiella piscicida]AIJ09351.1 Phosphoribosylglycinamide formyltransferase [Edwardsiella anguillarum ET080813]AKR77184.1 phosphoribosylglycinamide formyltransferase [Edwardsiella sp. LADL05-105]KAB0590400.1 phosphoribosylglycinamide formyltransferase [Edwardsiella anguillarum]